MINTKLTYLPVLILLTSLSFNTLAEDFPKSSSVPGGIAIIQLDVLDSTKPEVFYKKNRVMVRKNTTHWEAIVGIPLSAKPGIHKLSIHNADSKIIHTEFSISDKSYAEQRLKIKNKRMVNPNANDLKRINKEKSIIVNALKTWNEREAVDMSFILPVDGRLSSPFGLRRYFNDQARNPHSGLDVAAATGTPVKAPADGTILATGNFFFNGNTVFIDHGQGLITMYCHMNKISIQQGAIVKQGDIIGEVGETGRVTGPHLHWSVSLNDARIEPELFLDTVQLSQKKN
ncbi:MAG: peptidoglycan DD-metalloendopeptidase family protein [Gammaproteobacteria bacterium]|nr:peptidoglycan DD-metalloendopeptidase family protein [Gammaproteobacteria bacterium]